MADNGNVSDFLKLLVEWGSTYYVNDDDAILVSADDTPVILSINKNPLPLLLFSQNMKVGKHTYFNLLVETLGHSKERSWFTTSRSLIAGNLVRSCMVAIIDAAISKDSDMEYDKLELIQPYVKGADSKLISELNKIDPSNFLRIIYNKRRRTAQAQSDIFDDEFMDSLHLRKRSVGIIRDMMLDMFGTKDIHKEFSYKATIVSMQETDAFLHVMLNLSMVLQNYTKMMLDEDLKVELFEQHMEHLEKYRKSCAWAASGTIQQDKEAVKEEASPMPWRTEGMPIEHSAQFAGGVIPDCPGTQQMVDDPNGPGSDPTMFARMANVMSNNQYMDVSQAYAATHGLPMSVPSMPGYMVPSPVPGGVVPDSGNYNTWQNHPNGQVIPDPADVGRRDAGYTGIGSKVPAPRKTR